MIYNEIKFKNDEIYVTELLKMIKINNVEEIRCALKSKNSSIMINFNNDSKIDYFEIRMKSI